MIRLPVDLPPPAAPPHLASLVLARLAGALTLVAAVATAVPAAAQDPDDALRLRLSDLVSAFSAGTEAPLPIQTGLLSNPGEARYFEVPLEPDACYSFAVVAEDSLSDVDIHLYGQGVEVASHTGLDNTPVVHWCNLSRLDRASVEVRAYSGSGRFAFEVLRHQGQPPGTEGALWAALEAAVAEYAEGLRPALPPWQDVLAEGGEVLLDTSLLGGRTYVFVAAGAATVTDLDLVLLDASGVEVDADLGTNAQPVLRYAVPEGGAGAYRLRVAVVRGFGPVGLRILVDE